MKIAKKVLALAMAVAMVACFAAMAFAAENKVVLKATEVVDGKFNVEVTAVDFADLKAGNWDISYDPAVVSCVKADNNGKGDFANIANDPVLMAAASGQLQVAYNVIREGDDNKGPETGLIKVGFAFQENLGRAEDTVLFTLNFKVVDEEAANVELKLAGDAEGTLVVALKAEEETTAAPVETTTEEVPVETTTEEAPSTPEETTNKGVVAGPNTGDTGLLAIAAGVVAVAGAAFVVSKKRK